MGYTAQYKTCENKDKGLWIRSYFKTDDNEFHRASVFGGYAAFEKLLKLREDLEKRHTSNTVDIPGADYEHFLVDGVVYSLRDSLGWAIKPISNRESMKIEVVISAGTFSKLEKTCKKYGLPLPRLPPKSLD